jgi:TPR repeat protein
MPKSSSKKNLQLIINKNKDEVLFNKYKKIVQSVDDDKNKIEALYQLSNCYMSGIGIKINYLESLHYLKLSAYKGHIQGQYYLSTYYEKGLYIKKNTNKAVYWCKKSADQNFDLAQNHLGCYYEIGEYIDKNIDEAFKLYKKSAEQNNSCAQYNLATCYEYGKSIEKNIVQAFKWYLKAALQNHDLSQNKVGCFYENGKGTQKNINEAVKWYKKSSANDNCKSHYNLATCYKYNKGIEQNDNNLNIAFNLYKRAIDQGCKCTNTLYELALCYEHGEGIEKDFDKALNLYKQGAELDDIKSQYKLNEFYKNAKTPVIEKDLSYNDNVYDNSTVDYSDILNDSFSDESEEDNDSDNDSDTDTKTLELFKSNIDLGNIDSGNIESGNKELENYKKYLEEDLKQDLNYNMNNLDYIKKYKIGRNISNSTYNSNNCNTHINYVNMLYLKYTYNCGVLNHELKNYEEAINYYEEAAYNHYPYAQKALAYCYKNGIYYEKSLEKAKIWMNLYKNIEDVD